MKPQYNNHRLTWYSQDLAEIADNYGTPLHICCKNEVHESIRQFLTPFQHEQIPIKCFYSVKTNPVPGLLSLFKDEKLGVEVISEFELWLTRQLGFKGKQIIVNGPAKSSDLFRSAFDARVHMVTIETIAEARRLVSICDGQKESLDVAVRICPSLSSRFDPTLDSGSRDSPYGFFPGSEELWNTLKILHRCRQTKFCGYQVHLGSGIKNHKPYAKAFSVLKKLILDADKKGWKCRKIDIGGGFGLPSAPVFKPRQLAAALLLKGGLKSRPGKKEQLLHPVSHELGKMLKSLKQDGCEIEEVIAEPGRRLSGSGSVIILTVLDMIERAHGKRFLICDGGGMSLSPLFLTEAHSILPLVERDGTSFEYTILGNIPSSLDKVSTRVKLPRVEKGDRLAVLDTGAYFTSFNNNFAGPRPGIVLIDDNRTTLIRKRETFAEVVSRDTCLKINPL